MQNHVISLTTATDRRQHITQEFTKQNISFEFFDALIPDLAHTYAQTLPIDLENIALTGGELACFMSHASVWQQMIDQNIPYLAIFEDDVYLGEDAEALLTTTSWIKPEWHIIKIEAFSEKVFLSSNSSKIISDRRCIAQLKGRNLGTAGYILSLRGAQVYLDYISKNKLRPLDELMFDDFIKHGAEPVYQMTPALCIQEMLLNKGNPSLPSALIKDRQGRMKSEKKPAMFKAKREINRIGMKIKKAIFAAEVVFK
ncbi:probable glycosyl transferase family 25, LPS biosynthesis [Psychrobacter arcticus 273-4]|uniref:Probable glycosyl transferase family 25, LPS biosynthesis n=1 Tax=Psychrobacter arcticus (strain DSM 17307 / VKM B-2377 / 273-4) TaxID=259536 RepID=Q4FSF0_PSYA2|nr:glycosyltransferase family 25 protein [Psychrobacter arcticus]AAZ19058.1 probable glycosyl transferase family 25, LPS biosynthesis [Psychrobacter arcticus 273-4]